jgi:MFS transporter, putative metabolite:H+ symporter
VRARALSRAWTMNRVGAAGAPIVLLPILASGGPTLMFAVMGLAVGMSVLVLMFSPKANA